MKFQNWLFDWDGTLVTSSAAHEEAFLQTLADLDEEIRQKFVYSRVAGAKTEDVFKSLGINNGQEIKKLAAKKRNFYLEAVEAGKVQLFPGAAALLKTLKDNGARLFIVTGASENAFYRVAEKEKLASLFNGIITGADVQVGKPDPAGYALALKRYGLLTEQSIAVEDAISGIMAAKTCDIRTLGVHEPEIKNFCSLWFENLDKLRSWLINSDEI